MREFKKMVDQFCLIRKILPSSNSCKLVKNGHRFVKLRKYLCFCLFMQQRKISCTIFSETTAKCHEKDSNLRLLSFLSVTVPKVFGSKFQKYIKTQKEIIADIPAMEQAMSNCFFSGRSLLPSYCVKWFTKKVRKTAIFRWNKNNSNPVKLSKPWCRE